MHDFSMNHHHGDEHGAHSHGAPEHAGEQVKRAYVLMNYMYHHNEEHTQELAGMAEQLRSFGQENAAVLIEEAIAAYREGNEKLHRALHEFE